jgi:excisionase family DNA binding protein
MLRLPHRGRSRLLIHVLTTRAVIATCSLPYTPAVDSSPPMDSGGGHARHTHPATAMTDRELYRVTEAMEILSLKRSVIYEQLCSGRLRSVHVGRTRLITASAIDDYIPLLETEAAADTPFGAAS